MPLFFDVDRFTVTAKKRELKYNAKCIYCRFQSGMCSAKSSRGQNLEKRYFKLFQNDITVKKSTFDVQNPQFFKHICGPMLREFF